MGVLSTVAGGLAGLFVKKVTTVAGDGARVTRRQARIFTKPLACVLGFMVAWHFVLWPVLNFFFPEVGFPPLDIGLLGGLLNLGI